MIKSFIQTFDVTYFFNFLTHSPLEGFSHAFNFLSTLKVGSD